MTVEYEPQQTAEQLPSLISKSKGNFVAGQIYDAICECDDEVEVEIAIRYAAETSDMDYLFNIPGVLFEENDPFVCVIRYMEDETIQHGFVVLDHESQSVKMMDYDEVPKRAKAFFSSFAGVLSCLGDMPEVAKLH